MKYWFNEKRAVYTWAGEYDENGYIPSLCIEGEPGHRPMTGDKTQLAWYWGNNEKECMKACDKMNKKFGYTQEEVLTIIGSTMQDYKAVKR